DIRFNAVSLDASAILGTVGGGDELLDVALDLARVGLAAEMVGLSFGAFDLTLDYLKTRSQFGQLIGSFQALQHRVAKMAIALEKSRVPLYSALRAFDAGNSDRAALVSAAKAVASDLAHHVTCECLQLHGGIGMTDEHDIGLYLKRALVAETAFGSASFHRERYA